MWEGSQNVGNNASFVRGGQRRRGEGPIWFSGFHRNRLRSRPKAYIVSKHSIPLGDGQKTEDTQLVPGTMRLREAIWSYVFVEARAFQIMSDASLFLLPFGHLAFSPPFSLPTPLFLFKKHRYDSARREPEYSEHRIPVFTKWPISSRTNWPRCRREMSGR